MRLLTTGVVEVSRKARYDVDGAVLLHAAGMNGVIVSTVLAFRSTRQNM